MIPVASRTAFPHRIERPRVDAKRYQQIQDLFWEVEEQPHDEQESFLRERVGDDDDLLNEVVSLLREHDAEAARVEGRSVSPVRLPGDRKMDDLERAIHQESDLESDPESDLEASTPGRDTVPIDSSDIRETVPMEGRDRSGKSSPTTKKGLRRVGMGPGENTVDGAQRTHAAPRYPKPRRRRGRPDSVVSRSSSFTLPTSIGPPRLRFTWLPLWLSIVLCGVIPSWILAWSVGNAELSSQRQSRQRLLPASLDQARWKIESLLDENRRHAERLATDRRIGSIIRTRTQVTEPAELTEPTEPADAEQVLGDSVTSADETLVIWDREFRVLAVNTKRPLAREIWNTRYAGSVAQSLQGQTVFLGPGAVANANSPNGFANNPTGVGWFVPVMADDVPSDFARSPIGVLLWTDATLWTRVTAELRGLPDAGDLNVYLVDRQGWMQTELMETGTMEAFRVAEYRATEGDKGSSTVAPLTVAAASVTANPVTANPEAAVHPETAVHPEAYVNHTGGYSSGAWVWLPAYDLGLIVETPVQRYAGGLSLTWPWAMLASLLFVTMASATTWWHQRKITLLTDLRQPLGRYEIQRELGSGGMGVVYLARHKELGRDIALKVLRGDRQDEDDRQRFDREARLAATLSCPHSVTVFDFGYTAEDNAFCVMELLQGLTLAEMVARGGAQNPGRVIWIMQQICQSMLEAHGKGLMHRDLKPQNVMLRFDTVVGDWATVFDFGLAKPIEPDADLFQTSETIWAGTPMYMAPERFRDPSSMDPRSDIYSIGCIAYYLLAGNPPFVECDPESMFALIMSEHPIGISTHRSDTIDPRLDDWVRVCMSKDKHSRASDFAELNRSLQAMSAGMPWNRADAESWWMTHAKELVST